MESGHVSLEENSKETEDDTEDMEVEPEIAHADWSEYFNGLNGTAVIYDASNRAESIFLCASWKDRRYERIQSVGKENCDSNCIRL